MESPNSYSFGLPVSIILHFAFSNNELLTAGQVRVVWSDDLLNYFLVRLWSSLKCLHRFEKGWRDKIRILMASGNYAFRKFM